MAMATYSSTTYKQSSNVDGRAHPRDASFSSYLDSTERDFVRSMASSASTHHNSDRSSSPAWESFVTNTPRSRQEKCRFSCAGDELGVFGAERYFNEKLEDHKILKPNPTKNPNTRNQRNGTTISLKSQESWNNSQYNGLNLLSNLQGVCSNNKSSYKGDDYDNNNNNNNNNNNKFRERNKVSHHDNFEFPMIQSTSYNHLEGPQEARKSLEVFGFKHIEKQDMSFLAWDAIPNYYYQGNNNASFSFSYHPNTKTTSQSVKLGDHYHEQHCDNDARSDTSSDLFEIENLSSGFHHQSSCATSEASIEWSVVTASAAELSVASTRFENNNKKKKKVQKSSLLSSSLSGGLLLGCKSHKAIDVIVGSFNTRSNNKKN
ncbi:hypothetical protein vseg_013840 [Gypsophila vaccaria]